MSNLTSNLFCELLVCACVRTVLILQLHRLRDADLAGNCGGDK
jgi:hypothetical protein